MILRFSRGKVGNRLFKVRSFRSDLFLCPYVRTLSRISIYFTYLVAMNSADVVIRPIRSNELHLLRRFLHEAIFVPEGAVAPPEDVVDLL